MALDDPIDIAPAAEGPAVVAEPGWEARGTPRYKPIESYGLIGDLETAALVGGDGAIDWFCPNRFDAPSLFAAILDADRGGRFRIAPAAEATSKQLYLPDTAILLTRFSLCRPRLCCRVVAAHGRTSHHSGCGACAPVALLPQTRRGHPLSGSKPGGLGPPSPASPQTEAPPPRGVFL